MKYYVIHYPKRPERKEALIRQFSERNISLDDVTWVEGLNKDDHFVKWVKVKTNSPMQLGPIACSVKHYWVMNDIIDNDIPEAIIFEDDVVIDPEFDKLDVMTFPRDIGLLRLGAGVHVLDSFFQQNVKPDAHQTISINNPGGSEAFWVTNAFAESYSAMSNFDYSIDMTQHGHLMNQGKPLLLRYVCQQTSIGGGDSTTGECPPGDWQSYVKNFGKLKHWSFRDIVDEYRNNMTIMYPQKGHGLANTLMYLCDFYTHHHLVTSVVHDSINDYEVGRWLKFKFPCTSLTGIKRVYTPKNYVNKHTIHTVYPIIRHLVEPSDELKPVLESHIHLVKNVTAGLHIRRGASARDSRVVVEVDTDTFANDDAVAKFRAIAENKGPVFLASDSPETKKKFSARMIDTTIAVVHGNCPDAPTHDRRNIFVDFFLLSMCPRVFITGGNFPNLPGLSTFGLMAAIYGNKPLEIISN